MNGAPSRPVVIIANAQPLAITRLGFGCARLFAGQELRASARLVEAALDAGVRHFDTAPVYSGGQAEEVLGAVLAGVSDVSIATKVGLGQPSDRAPTAAGSLYRRTLRPLIARVPGLKARLLAARASMEDAAQPLSHRTQRLLGRDEIHRSLEGSLQRLKRTTVDVFLLHEPEQFTLAPETLDTMEALVREGTIRAFGQGFGGAPDSRSFGCVRQFRYEADVAAPEDGATVLLHGVLRVVGGARLASPALRLAAAQARFPRAGIIFSASHPKQIQHLSRLIADSRECAS